MKLHVQGSNLRGAVDIPGSKSHTIRAVAIASLAQGTSAIERPLYSSDARAAVAAYRALGAQIDDRDPDVWHVEGIGGRPAPPPNVIDVGNSGTTLRIALGTAALLREHAAVFTGDKQIRSRPCGPLAKSLNDLGARIEATLGNGSAPLVVHGRLTGGETTIESITSQYLTSLLMATPLAEGDSTIHVPVLHERPYVGITLDWLERQGIAIDANDDWSEFTVRGRQQFAPVNRAIPGDFSSATFFLAAGALNDNEVRSRGLDLSDTQGDKAVIDYLKAFGAHVETGGDGVLVRGRGLHGCEIDLNNTPDALPMMAVVACFARGTTRLVNVPQARLKETDRIAVMCAELTKLGARISELPDGLVIEESALHAAEVDGHDDHRVVMALAIAGTMLSGTTTINGAEAVDVTYPRFADHLRALGGHVQTTGAATLPAGDAS